MFAYNAGMSLPTALYTVAQVRAFDAHAIATQGAPGIELMKRAGAAAVTLLRRRWPAARRVAVLCGAGNNGGDG
jgi:NAD(P)H-hydrate epimerase